MADQAVFFDPSGRRKRRFTLALVAFFLLLLLSVGLGAVTIGFVPRAPLLPVLTETSTMAASPVPHGNVLRRGRRGLDYLLKDLNRPANAGSTPPLAMAFHRPWEEASVESLKRHIDSLDWVLPAWLMVTGPAHKVASFNDPAGRAIINQAVHRPTLIPLIQNASGGQWDAIGIASLLADKQARKALLDKLEVYLAANHANGVMFDFEELTPRARSDFRLLLSEAHARFARHNWIVTIAVPVGDSAWDTRALAPLVDRLFIMDYDEHSNDGEPGPIASQRWFIDSLASAIKGIPRSKLVIAIGNYGYDWHDGGGEPVSVEEAWLAASESDTRPVFDPVALNSGFAYTEDGHKHVVWLLDAASAYNQLKMLDRAGLNQVALWALGSEDPGIWSFFGRSHPRLPPASQLETIPAGTIVDIEGTGEILRVNRVPVSGQRRFVAGRDGSISGVDFTRMPSPFVINRGGARANEVALTFDDGPDPDWTAPILDVLKAKHVPATFFVIGDNALTQRALLNRIIDEGHEVGSHTYTHPNMAKISPTATLFELNATQRLFEAFTGRTLRLFRAPYFGDAEPTTADEIYPALAAQNRGYINIGLHVDPEDWQRPGVDKIVASTIDQVTHSTPDRSANIVLLHDGGGDRSQTVAALPAIIDGLRARGFRFVPVTELVGISRQEAMPPLNAADRAAARTDLFIFSAIGFITWSLRILFIVAITLGIARALLLAGLALIQAKREARQTFPPIDPAQFVSVLIPAYNEAAVIERSVRGVLDSSDVRVEVIVIDDGSTDATSAIVAAAFADDSRVQLVRLANGGKARALNHGLTLAKGDILVALDADTQFEPTTIARLARWFADPTVGAVAGNAKVGNRVNLVTRWQALEYITAQNLERRALARLDAMTVVPGAVGAWRASAIAAVGGYPADTLAEDQDLTIAIQRAGWKIQYDQYAIAWTEAPQTLHALAKQRFRWAFGTLQCLYKHRSVIARGRPRGLALIGLPQAVLFQILFAAISPIIDLALLVNLGMTWSSVEAHGWAQSRHDVENMLIFWLAFTAIDVLAAVVAFALERREQWRLLWLLIPQRIGYRQMAYYVVVKALAQALRGPQIGWGKLERTGLGHKPA